LSQKLKSEWEAFLAAVEEFPHIRRAAKHANVHYSTHYRKYKLEPEYAARFEESWAIGVGRIRDIAIRRAVLGYDEPVIYKGEYQFQEILNSQTGKIEKKLVTVRKFPERLLMKVLTGEIPDVYNRSIHEHTGEGGKGPIEVVVRSYLDPKPE
jgi:hypothetical protein